MITLANSARVLIVLLAGAMAACGVAAQVGAQRTPAASGEATVRLAAEQQRKEGDLFIADGKVEILYRNYRLRADHVQYNPKTYLLAASGHVQLDDDTPHLGGDTADFTAKPAEGRFDP